MKSSKYISILCMGGLLSLASCTDGFESDNKINGSFDDTLGDIDALAALKEQLEGKK